MNRGLYIALHAAGASAFGFVLQRYALHEAVEVALVWAAAFGLGAIFIAWKQTSR